MIFLFFLNLYGQFSETVGNRHPIRVIPNPHDLSTGKLCHFCQIIYKILNYFFKKLLVVWWKSLMHYQIQMDFLIASGLPS